MPISLSIHLHLILGLRPIRQFLVLVSIIVLVLVPAASVAQGDGTWSPFPPPAPRYAAATAYDPVSDGLFVFGGWLGAGVTTSESWFHGFAPGSDWQRRLLSGPAPQSRSRATLTYDPVRSRVILFGGYYVDPVLGAVYLNDVWTASPSGTGWTALNPAGTPPPVRADHVTVYDAAQDRLLIFGGANTTTPELSDTWELTLSGTPQWSQVNTNTAPARKRAAAILDGANSRLVVFGGSVGSTSMNDVWALSLSNPIKWTVLSVSGTPPSPREGHTGIFDPVQERMIVFGGGYPYISPNNEVWSLSLSGSPQWTQLSLPGTPPAGRSLHGAAWDGSGNNMIIFGGYVSGGPYQNDLWVCDMSGGGWNEIPPVASPGFIDNAASFFDPARNRLVVFGGYVNGALSNQLWVRGSTESASWMQIPQVGSWPSARSGARFVHDATGDRAILYGGVGNEVWSLDLASNEWTELIPTGTAPTPRPAFAIALDAASNRVLIFGGGSESSPLNDVWELALSDPPVWNQLFPSGAAPLARIGASAVVDPSRDRMIIFGGGRGPGFMPTYYNDVWALSLSGTPAWGQLSPSGTPPNARVHHAAFFDTGLDRMVVYSGGQSIGTFVGVEADIWELQFAGSPHWNELHPDGVVPPSRLRSAWGFESTQGILMVYGGWSIAYGAQNDAWALRWGSALGIPGNQTIARLRVIAAPNPLLSHTTLRFHLEEARDVHLSVRDVQGRTVAVLVDHRVLPAGDHEIAWEPQTQSLGSGVYFYDLVAGQARASGRLVLLR